MFFLLRRLFSSLKIDRTVITHAPFGMDDQEPLLGPTCHAHILHREDSTSGEAAVYEFSSRYSRDDARSVKVANHEVVVILVRHTKEFSLTLSRTVDTVVRNALPATNIVTMGDVKLVTIDVINLPPRIIYLPGNSSKFRQFAFDKFINDSIPVHPMGIFALLSYSTMIPAHGSNVDFREKSKTFDKKVFDEVSYSDNLMKEVLTDVLFLARENLGTFNDISKHMNMQRSNRRRFLQRSCYFLHANEEIVEVFAQDIPVKFVKW